MPDVRVRTMSIDYDTDADGDWYDGEDDGDPGCTWCGGDGIGDGCGDPIQCCGEDFCHPCRGSGRRDQQTVF